MKDEQGSIFSEEMAEMLNKFFTSVYTIEDLQEIPRVPIYYQGMEPLRKINVTRERVREKKKLNANKSPGPDGFDPREFQ